ncbi:hypothetical protein BDZ97DRAFT_2076019 [Flammula alnicola]|nr:hypothetical protein BDZ97DRAFT_2076019 [Flammula alnicola]
MKFYCGDWTDLTTYDNDKSKDNKVLKIIEQVTGVTSLQGFRPTFGYSDVESISTRMSWAASRVTTRAEDRAYSLMGIFNVSFSIAYGEGGERAFFRLIDAILSSVQTNFDVLNWEGRPIPSDIHPSRVIPSGPECYLKRSTDYRLRLLMPAPTEPMTLTHLGLKMELLVIRAELITHPKDVILRGRDDSVAPENLADLGMKYLSSVYL